MGGRNSLEDSLTGSLSATQLPVAVSKHKANKKKSLAIGRQTCGMPAQCFYKEMKSKSKSAGHKNLHFFAFSKATFRFHYDEAGSLSFVVFSFLLLKRRRYIDFVSIKSLRESERFE